MKEDEKETKIFEDSLRKILSASRADVDAESDRQREARKQAKSEKTSRPSMFDNWAFPFVGESTI